MSYERFSTDIDLDDTEAPTRDPVAWKLLHAVVATRKAVEEIAYNMRVVTHLLANSDHRHLAAYAKDMDAAVERLEPVDAELRRTAANAADEWAVSPSAPLSTLIQSAPDVVGDALTSALAELQTVTRELQSDGSVADQVLEGAAVILAERRRATENAGPDPTYRSAATATLASTS